MKLLISLLHLFFCGNLIAQTLEIKSRKNSTNVPFASVKFFKKGIIKGGTYSNEKGLVYLDLTNDIDSILITHLNFKSKKIAYNSNNNVVFLEDNLIELAEVKISPNQNKKSIIGTTLNKENIFIDAKTGFEICSFIPSSNAINKRLIKFIFNVKRKKEKKDALVKLHFYKNENNTPTSLINFNQDITVILSFKKKGVISAEIEKYNIFVPESGFFVGVEWLGLIDANGKFSERSEINDCSIAYNFSINKSLSFVRNRFIYENWDDLNNIVFIQNKYCVPAFSFEVE